MRITTCFGDPFEGQFALRLKSSARAQGLRCDLFESGRNVRGGPARISSAILKSLGEHGGEDILYVEPEAEFHRRPDILLDERDFDIAVHYDQDTLAVSGPVFLRNSPRIRPLMRDWIQLNRTFPGNPEAANLSLVLARPLRDLVVRRIPVTYAWVERMHRRAHPRAKPVIVHFETDGLISGRIKVPG